jgi:hypothetical protein
MVRRRPRASFRHLPSIPIVRRVCARAPILLPAPAKNLCCRAAGQEGGHVGVGESPEQEQGRADG